MSRAVIQFPSARLSAPPIEPEDALGDENPDPSLDQVPDDLGEDELTSETGIDLTDASDLDADNVPADEENDRVVQAPD